MVRFSFHSRGRLFVAAILAVAACLTEGHAVRAGYITLWDNGPSDNRVNVVFLGDGYTADQIDTVYVDHIHSALDYMFLGNQEPFNRYADYFNVHRINVISSQSGADIPSEGIYRNTALDASYSWGGGVERLLYANSFKVSQTLSTNLAGAPFSADIELVTVNETKYGGGGGTFAVFAGGNSQAPELALHEIGHSFSSLADEYGGHAGQTYSGSEPAAVNVTKSATGAKWAQWIGYEQPGVGTIGVYQGGYYYDQGIYRPSSTSKMYTLGKPFNAVSREKIVLDIYASVDPLDDWLDDGGSPLVDPAELWVEPIDPDVILVDWSIGGVPVAINAGGHFAPTDFIFSPGVYTVSARAYDPTDWVRINLDELEQTVSWTIQVTQVPEPVGWLLGLLALASLIVWGRPRRAA